MSTTKPNIFRGMSPEKKHDPLINNGSINALTEDPENFTFEDMLEVLNENEGYQNIRTSTYPNWTLKPGWVEKFTDGEAIVLIADYSTTQLSENNYRWGNDLYVESVPWEHIEEIIYPKKKEGEVQSHISEAEKEGVTLTPATNVYQQTIRQYKNKHNQEL
ncbi:hypothetical protein [Candidatus Nanohalobium constans]|uniref:Uncharacterized protein n=1 Tax=Candidatus Nanohalobium constans TaxID=2565781 RepID=A0A5Q0UFT9_9ARCH|nr:hypothetical protein [Candidatus Nanohalobium constans]QGA80468.1 hypothetical protein LC1Nh_0571 [Candidatus Nanohalobium constans]